MTTTNDGQARSIPLNPIMDTDGVEREIRFMANGLVNDVIARRAHPTYGYTKTSIVAKYQRLCGMVGLYAFITGQTMNAQGMAPSMVRFTDRDTIDVVQRASSMVDDL